MAGWKESTSPNLPAAKARILHTAPWPTLDEINAFIERYWRERQEVADAWEEFPEETRTTLITLGVKPPEK